MRGLAHSFSVRSDVTTHEKLLDAVGLDDDATSISVIITSIYNEWAL